jgi:hypothetical protein
MITLDDVKEATTTLPDAPPSMLASQRVCPLLVCQLLVIVLV